MSRVTLKSQAIVIDQLTAQVAELTTQVGVLMNQLEASNQLRSSLQDERDDLIVENQRLVESTIAAHERCDTLEAMVAKPSAPVQAPRKPAPKPQVPVSEIDAQPVVQVTDSDRRIWSAFKALPREKRQSYYDFARASVGHLGIHNIAAVREAYLAQQAA
tara:strand:+ start:222 stop:701 length:480 start_codon:yes stop_codon:yes gene_type:complete